MREVKHGACLRAAAIAAAVVAAVAVAPAAQSDRTSRVDRLTRALDAYVESGQLAGIVALVLKDGAPVYERAVGWRDKEQKRPMTMDTVFRIASQSKAITSAAVLSLVEEGRVSLGDRVSRFIPEFAATSVAVAGESGLEIVPARRPVTIKDLLTHTAGISYGTDRLVAALYEPKGLGPAAGFGYYTADKDEPICDTMARLGTLPFVAHPGERYVYGYNTDILGCVVERASGQSLDAFIKTRITGPIGMTDTHFFLPAADRDRLATVYMSGPEGTIVRAPDGARGQGHYVDGPRKSFAGGAGLVSTAGDYARFLETIRRGGELDGVRILAPRTVQLMTTNQVGSLHSNDGLGFGLGFQTTDRYGANGMDGVGAFGWAGAYGTTYRVDPQSGIVMVMMIQMTTNRTDIRTTFPTLVYQAFADGAR